MSVERCEDRTVPASLTFQQGLGGYAGTTDTDLFSLDANTNFADNTFISIDQQDFDNVHHGLLRFADIFTNDPINEPNKVPFGSVITKATLTVSIINESNQACLLSLFRMNTNWNEGVATWNSFGPLGGIQTDGTEAERTPDFTLDDTASQGLKNLDVFTSLQAWSNGIANHGWALVQYSSNGWDFESSEAATNQPKLVVDFTPPSGAGSFTFTQPSYAVVEGDSGSKSATILVARQGGNLGTVSVDYEIKAGTATGGVDFDNTITKGTLTFSNPNTVFLPITVPILGDATIEGTERFTIELSNAIGGSLGKTTVADVVIADQDVLINEVLANVSNAADDGYEFIELIGTPGASLNGLQVVIFEGETEEAGGGVGVADMVVDLTGQTLGSNGILTLTPTAFKYSLAPGSNQLIVPQLNTVGGGIEDSSLTVTILRGGAILTKGTDYDLDTMPAVPANNLNVGLINATDPLFGYDILDSMGWTEMGGSDADRQITFVQPGIRLNQPQGQKVGPADDKSTSSDAGSRFVGDKSPNNIGSWFNGDVLNPNVPVAYDLPPRAYVNNPAGASVTPGGLNTQRVITYVVSSYTVTEAGGKATLTVDRLGDVSTKTDVTFTTVDGTAKAGSDYTFKTGTVTFNINDTTQTIDINIISDGKAEGFETFGVKLSAPTSPFLIATSTATVKIEDADAKVNTFRDGDLVGDYTGTADAGIYGWKSGLGFGSDLVVAVDQADANLVTDPLRPDQGMIRFDDLFGSGPGQVPFGSTILNAFVTFNVVSPTAASANVRLFKLNHDWDQSTTTWANPTFTPGITNGVRPDGVEAEATPDGFVPTPGISGPVDVAVSVDTIQAWANEAAPNYGWQIINDVDDDWNFVSSEGFDAATRPALTIIYTPPSGTGTFTFAEPTFEVNENGGTATLTVLRVGANSGTVNVNWSITGGNATAGDYGAPTSGSLSFGPTDYAKSITLPIVNDSSLEANETVQFTLTGATFTRDQATLVIRDNDFNVASPTLLINEFETNSIGQDQPFEYVEFTGPANTGAGGLYFLAIEGDNNNWVGSSDFAHDLSRLKTGSNGIILVKAFSGGHATPDANSTIDFNALFDTTNTNALRGFDSDHTNSYLLIYSPTATFGEFYDFDWNNDGTLDLPAGAVIVDAVGQNDGGGGDIVYGGVSLSLPLDINGQPIWVPDQVSRFRGNTTANSAAAYFYGDHLGTDDALVYDTAKVTGLPISGAAANPGQINVAATSPLVSLASVTIDNGTSQRSMVRSVTLNFNGAADRLLTDGIALTTDKGAPVAGVNLLITGINSNTWTITFTGSPIIGGSLADGKYLLAISGVDLIAAGRTVDAANTLTPGTNRLVNFHRFFGDFDGDATIAASDFIQFRLALGGSSPIFDFDGDGSVAASDFIQFRLRFGGSI